MTTMLIANNCTRESGSFMGDQLCALKTAYLFVDNQPDVTKVIMTMSPGNEMSFVWDKFIHDHNVEIIWDNWDVGNWAMRWDAWDRWRTERHINGVKFDHYRELHLRIHGSIRQPLLCGLERGLGRKNIYEYWLFGQENKPETCVGSDWYDDTLAYHIPLTGERDVYIAPHCKTQGNVTFTFDYWSRVVCNLLNAGVTVTVGYDGYFYDEEFNSNPLYKKHWGTHQQWFDEVCKHKIVACGNTGTGWVAAACGVPMITMEPHASVMADHRYRECGLRNLVEVVDGYKLDEMSNDMTRVADYVSQKIIAFTSNKVVMTTGCYDVVHAGHIRHLKRARAMGTKLIVALNSDKSVSSLKGPTRPINNETNRKAVLEAIKYVDEVRIFDGENAVPLIKEVKPKVLACGYGYTTDTVVGKDLVESWGGKVAITCSKDATVDVDEPSTTKIVRKVIHSRDVNEVCRLAATYSVNPFDKLKLLADELLSVSHLQGYIADLGSYKGGSALVMRRLAPDEHLHLFDTWEGNPHDDELCHHKKGEWYASISDCMLVVGEDGKTNYHKGIFPHDVPQWSPKCGYRFIYCDMDTYKSTIDAIEFFWSNLVSGGKMVFDDYGWEPCAGVKKAVDLVFQQQQPPVKFTMRVIESQYTCIIEKK